MRLLEYNDEGEFRLTGTFSDETPQYAILSHTWEAEEVTFRDLVDGTGKGKAGYRKIQFCGERARRDGLQYFWVDTCCIDKSNSTELARAINSMFRWYQNAAKCYVYLSDVWARKRKASDGFSEYTWESAFRGSRWFTRGWTLQELLAPRSVEFFSQEGKRLGDKRSLERQVHQRTGIAVSALQGTPLSQFGVDERLLWAENRQTTYEEDEAYSLLGIFNVFMPLIYGEGKEYALLRLREEIDKPLKGLDRLPSADDAPFNSYNNQHAPTCLLDTRVDLLQEIYNWADGQDRRCIFWLNGLAGTGKSTIARTIARRYLDQKRLGASFFFSRGGGDVSHAGKFFTSFAVQLARNVPQIQRFISDAVIERNNIANQSLRDQWRQLVFYPLSRLNNSPSLCSYVLIVDGLDECNNEDHIRIILQLLAEARSLEVRLRVLITSRPEVPIRHGFCQIPDIEHRDFILHDIEAGIVDHDIFVFLKHELRSIGQERNLGADWPGDLIIRQLVQKASGLFIWAATACRFICEGKQLAKSRLNAMLQGDESIRGPEGRLNDIYLTVLKNSLPQNCTEQEQENLYGTLKEILGSIVTLLSPLSAGPLATLLHIPRQDVDQTLEDLHSILDIPEHQARPLRLHHPSFRDFLLDRDRCSDLHFWVDKRQAHQTLADNCIQLMSTSLKQDVCGQAASGTLLANIKSNQIEQCLPLEVRYACLYWVEHLQKSGIRLYDNEQVHHFLQVHLLHWLEALGWMGKTSEGILAITSLESIALINECPRLYALVHDTKRFALYSQSAIKQAPLQVYSSALVFAPTMSIVRRNFIDRIPRFIQRVPNARKNWSALLQTLEDHTSGVTAVAFSPDGQQLASASQDKTVRLWDVMTGAVLQILEGHTDLVMAVAFSPDGQKVASASDDKTIRLWDTVTGVALQTLKGHTDRISVVVFSPDGQQLASASASGYLELVDNDKTVWLWDAMTGAILQTLEGHTNGVNAVAFSPNGQQLASASKDKTVRLWDITTGAVLQTLEAHSCTIRAIVFSSDGQILALASSNKTVQLWDTARGVALQTLEGHIGAYMEVAFSPDGQKLVSASGDKTVQLWDVATGAALQTLEGYIKLPRAVVFSPNCQQLALASGDRTVQLWDTTTGAALQAHQGHTGAVIAVGFSPDGRQLASASTDGTVRLWDAATSTVLRTLKGHTSTVVAVGFSPDGQQLASASNDKTVQLWDAATGTVLQTLKGHTGAVIAVGFSPDGQQLASASTDGTVRLWGVATSSIVLQIFKGSTISVNAVAFSPDGQQLASASEDNTVQLWDVTTGATLQTLKGHTNIIAVAFSPNSQQLASASIHGIVRLWDAATGALLQTLDTRGPLYSLSFSMDGSWLQTSSGATRIVSSLESRNLHQSIFPKNIFLRNQWIARGENNILWLPNDYRPWVMAVHENTIAMGYRSGHVFILQFGF